MQVTGQIDGVTIHGITIDTATDVPCIAQPFINSHLALILKPIHPNPPVALQLKSAQGAAMLIQGYIKFNLTSGESTVPVEAVVIPHLGTDTILLDNSTT